MKRILITGESSGIGKAVSLDLRENPFNNGVDDPELFRIFGTYSTTLPEKENPGLTERFRWDVRREAPVLLEKEIAVGMDAIVHCVGVNKLAAYGKMNMTEFKEVMDVNVYGTANLLNLVAKVHPAGKPCKVVIVGSVAARIPMRMSAAYNASKAAQAMLVRQAAREFGTRFSVVGVQPSFIPGTKMSDYVKTTVKALRNQTDAEFDDYQLKISPVGRYATMNEVVACIRWLITGAPAQALTGQFLTPSCGA